MINYEPSKTVDNLALVWPTDISNGKASNRFARRSVPEALLRVLLGPLPDSKGVSNASAKAYLASPVEGRTRCRAGRSGFVGVGCPKRKTGKRDVAQRFFYFIPTGQFFPPPHTSPPVWVWGLSFLDLSHSWNTNQPGSTRNGKFVRSNKKRLWDASGELRLQKSGPSGCHNSMSTN
jgi:hypothetical protein